VAWKRAARGRKLRDKIGDDVRAKTSAFFLRRNELLSACRGALRVGRAAHRQIFFSEMFPGEVRRRHDLGSFLLLTFIPHEHASEENVRMLNAWHHGDVDTIAGIMRDAFRDFPAFGERLIGARNRKWIPEIEGYLRSGRTYFVVVGAGHIGGPEGLLALLKARGYQVEQL
jgi:pheromone shutdown protein TraB